MSSKLPLSALLSQVLVAFTLEFDNEFERRMGEAGYPGAMLSYVVWANLMRFIEAVTVRELAQRAMAQEKSVKFQLGCLERWGFVTLDASVRRDGWGSGRGIRAGWIPHQTDKGRAACEIWPLLPGEMEQRWRERFGDAIEELRHSLEAVVGKFDRELPQALPGHWDENAKYSAHRSRRGEELSLLALLSQILLAFRLVFDRSSPVPLMLCANALRVLGEDAIPEAEIPRLTGGSAETSGIGWQIRPYIVVEPAAGAKRGKLVRLSLSGIRAKEKYFELTDALEKGWKERFGAGQIRQVRESLRELFVPRMRDRLLIAGGLIPAPGTVRSGVELPALGRRAIGPAARQRMRDMAAQSAMFQKDPAGTLPHYPLWDMNRGFGP